MKWYVAELIVQCRVGKKPKRRTLYDRQVKVFRAATNKAAYERALDLGRAENTKYKNSAGDTVFWRFLGLANLDTLSENRISDGTEIYSRLEHGNPEIEVCPKRSLSVFLAERNKHRIARELLNSTTRPFAPR
jgi:hypothetical protein